MRREASLVKKGAIRLFCMAALAPLASAPALAIDHDAWVKIKVTSQGVENNATDLLGKAKVSQICYWLLGWSDFSPFAGNYVCEMPPGVWSVVAGGSVFAWRDDQRLMAGSCAVLTAAGGAAGVGYFIWSWQQEPDGALKRARVKTVSAYALGTLDGVNNYQGDCKISGKNVPASQVPQGAKDLLAP